jgi:cadmium resistance transport/sequestration family protein
LSDSIAAIAALGLTVFIATDVDDLFILIAFFADRAFRTRQVVIGQFLGIIALLAVSSLSYFFRLVIPIEWIGLMGLIPVYLGIHAALDLRKSVIDDDERTAEDAHHSKSYGYSKILSVSLVTIANGGDNIGVYAPLFASSSPLEIALLAGGFLVMTGVWLGLAYGLVNNPLFGAKIQRIGRFVLPVVLIGLGVIILIRCGTLTWLWGFLA